MRARHAVRIAIVTGAMAAWAWDAGAQTAGAMDHVAYDPDGLVRVESRVDADSVTVGQRFTVTQEFTYPDSLTMLPEGKLDLGKTRVLSVRWTQTPSDGSVTRRASIAAITLDLDGATIPQLEFDFVTPSGDTVRTLTQELDVPVRLIAADSAGLNPLKEPWEAPRSLTAWIVAGIAALLLAALIIWWWRRRRARGEEAPPEPKLPADYVALNELTRIEKLGLLDAGEFKQYYTLIVDAVRRYIEDRYGVEAMDRTTGELLDDLARRGIEPPALGRLLNEADLVKFARYTPGRSDGEAAMRAARDVVVKTAPRPAAADTTPVEAVSSS